MPDLKIERVQICGGVAALLSRVYMSYIHLRSVFPGLTTVVTCCNCPMRDCNSFLVHLLLCAQSTNKNKWEMEN